jgi:hypothetical protein
MKMAKASLIEARKAQAMTSQATALAELADQVAKLEAKIDRLIELQQPPARPAEKKIGK